MKTLTRHLLYLAIFLGFLLFVAGLTLFREVPVWEVTGGVAAMIAALTLVVWASFRLVISPETPPVDKGVYTGKQASYTT